jgi:hypothetical protein
MHTPHLSPARRVTTTVIGVRLIKAKLSELKADNMFCGQETASTSVRSRGSTVPYSVTVETNFDFHFELRSGLESHLQKLCTSGTSRAPNKKPFSWNLRLRSLLVNSSSMIKCPPAATTFQSQIPRKSSSSNRNTTSIRSKSLPQE